jgi:hypothetical protein
MTPGTRPARRSDRAAPLPARGRAVAFIALTVAMTRVLCDAFSRLRLLQYEKAASAATRRRPAAREAEPQIASAYNGSGRN